MEIRVEPPHDNEVRKQLIFNTRFHDVDQLIQAVPPGIIDYQMLGQIAAQIQQSIHVSPVLEDYVLQLWNAVRYPHESGIVLDDINMSSLIIGGSVLGVWPC